MRVPVLRTIRYALLGLSIATAGAPAYSTIYNISATSAGGTALNLAAGQTYLAKWIGIADGGLYDSASVQFNCASQCTTGFSNAIFSRRDNFNPQDFDIDVYTKGQVYATAAEALAAYKAGNNINHFNVHILNGAPADTISYGPVPNPFIITVGPNPEPSHLFVLDTDGILTNNLGGVSISIVAIPEPAAWSLMIAGFALLGAAVRRRRLRYAV